MKMFLSKDLNNAIIKVEDPKKFITAKENILLLCGLLDKCRGCDGLWEAEQIYPEEYKGTFCSVLFEPLEAEHLDKFPRLKDIPEVTKYSMQHGFIKKSKMSEKTNLVNL